MGKLTPLSKHVIRSCGPAFTNCYFDFPNCTFLGGLSDQPFTAFFIWEKFFTQQFGHKPLKRFIEFGCDQGNTSIFFVLWCLTLGANYVGYDNRALDTYKNRPIKRLLKMHTRMRIGDGYKRAQEIHALIQQPGRTVIFTDCVDKPWEFRTFAPMLKKGDILAVHDWDRAIFDDWVQDVMKNLQPYKLLYEKERLQLRTLTRFFLKR